MGKLKRIVFEKKKSVMSRGKEYFRTHADAAEAQKVMQAYMPQHSDYELVELCAANNMLKKDVIDHFAISEATFNKHFGETFDRGKVRRNMKTTKTLYDMANGTEGVYDAKKKRWAVRPRSPDVTALIWWDKTRGGWREGTDLNLKGAKGLVQTQVVVYLPTNGREAGAGGDPTFMLRKQQKQIEGTAKEVSKSKAVKNKPAR